MIKKILTSLLLASFLLCACSTEHELNSIKDSINKIEERVESLELLCKEMNTNISSLSTIVGALQQNDCITNVTPIMQEEDIVGYTIAFKNANAITIYNGKDGSDGKDGVAGSNGRDGTDGSSPIISVKKDADGVYYWTINGEWLLEDNGEKLPVRGEDGTTGKDGVTPKLKIGQDGNWYISYDNESTWILAGPAKGKDGDAFFEGVQVEDDLVVFTLSGGTTFCLPRYVELDIHFSNNSEVDITAGQSINIPYTLSGSDATKAMVSASSDGHYKVDVDEQAKTIKVTCPAIYVDGFINVMVSDGEGYTKLKVIKFYERKMSFTSGLDYAIDASGGNILVPIELNFEYDIKIDQNWVSLAAQTKATLRSETLEFNVLENPNDKARSATISIIPNNTSEVYAQISITQATYQFSINKSITTFTHEGGQSEIQIVSFLGLSVIIPNDCNWLDYTTDANNAHEYILTLSATQNFTLEPRKADIEIWSKSASEENKILATISVVQAASGSDNPNAMIITVKPLFANDFKVFLPIVEYERDLDCFVDWGDGTVENYKTDKKVVHRYNEPAAGTTFDVKITGHVPVIHRNSIADDYLRSIIAVKQWGNVGVKDMRNAFSNFKNLVSIPADVTGAFALVTDFAYAFDGCSSLTSIPSGLFTYAVNATDFSYIFRKCTALQTLPSHLFENCAKANLFNYAFASCTALTSLPVELFYNCPATSFRYLFSGCDHLENVGNNLFKNCSNALDFTRAFENCTALGSLPENLFVSCRAATDFVGVFYRNTSLTTVPANLFEDCVKAKTFLSTFDSCTKLSSIPEDLFASNIDVQSFESTFASCGSLLSVPVSLFDNNRKVKSFRKTFASCSKVSGESPYTEINSKKCHVPERKNYPDYFITPDTYDYMYDTSFSDRSAY